MPNSSTPPSTPSGNDWVQLRFQINKNEAEQLEDALLAAGAVAVTFEDQKDEPLLEPGVGETPLWQHLTVAGLFEASLDTDAVIGILKGQWPNDTPPDYQLEIIEDKDWEREWMTHYEPMRFGKRLWVCPSWIEQPDPKATNLMLDPGLAFGTGTHPTTALCLEWLDGQDLQGKTVLDFGCGSGILGIAALLLGAKQVIAIDNDPQALDSTLDSSIHLDKVKMTVFVQELEGASAAVANVVAGFHARVVNRLAHIFRNPRGRRFFQNLLVASL